MLEIHCIIFDRKLCFYPPPPYVTLSLFWSNPLPPKRLTYFLNFPLLFCTIILFDFLLFEVPNYRERSIPL